MRGDRSPNWLFRTGRLPLLPFSPSLTVSRTNIVIWPSSHHVIWDSISSLLDRCNAGAKGSSQFVQMDEMRYMQLSIHRVLFVLYISVFDPWAHKLEVPENPGCSHLGPSLTLCASVLAASQRLCSLASICLCDRLPSQSYSQLNQPLLFSLASLSLMAASFSALLILFHASRSVAVSLSA